MINDIKKISVSVEQIDVICKRLGKQISKDFSPIRQEPAFVS